jgi:hypothetical protein
VSLFGTHDATQLQKIEIYWKVGAGAYQLSPQLASTGIQFPNILIFSWAGNYGAGFNPGDVLTFYAKLHYLNQAGVAKTLNSAEKSITLPPRP